MNDDRHQVRLQHGDRMDPARTFEVNAGGTQNVELPNLPIGFSLGPEHRRGSLVTKTPLAPD